MKNIIFFLVILFFPNIGWGEYVELSNIKLFSQSRLQNYSIKLSSVDSKFEGVIAFGKSLNNYSEKSDLNNFTIYSSDYWRAVMEMAPSDPSILFATAYMHFMKGDISLGEVYLLLGSLGMEKSFKSELDEYQILKNKLSEKVQLEMKKGIDLHDKEKYNEALSVYNSVLQEYPKCAWAYYEKGFVYLLIEKASEQNESVKESMFKACRDIDPFYWQAYQGKDEKVFKKITPLSEKIYPFYSGEKRDIESFVLFAEGCRQTELFAIAAHAEWKLLGFDDKTMQQKHIKLFLENLDSLNLKEIDFFRSQFKLD